MTSVHVPASPANRRASLLLALLVALSATGCRKESEALAAPAARAAERVRVRVAVVEPRSFPQRIRAQANVLPDKKAVVLPRVPATIRRFHADVGDRVKAGAALASLDQADFQLAVEQAAAGLAQAEAGHALAEVGHGTAEKNYHRFKGLHDENAIPDSDFEKAETGYRMAAAQLQLAEARLAMGRVGVKAARRKLADTTVRAPFAGVVTARMKDPGEMAVPQAPLFMMADVDPAIVEGGVPEAARIEGGDPAVTTLDAFPGERFEGTVARVDPTVDPRSRTVKVRVRIDNPDGRLMPGMSARLEILRGDQQGLAVPREALVVDGVGRGHVFAVEKGDVAQRRKVTFVPGTSAWVLLESGLARGERIVTAGVQQLADGTRVTVEASNGKRASHP